MAGRRSGQLGRGGFFVCVVDRDCFYGVSVGQWNDGGFFRRGCFCATQLRRAVGMSRKYCEVCNIAVEDHAHRRVLIHTEVEIFVTSWEVLQLPLLIW